MDFNGVKTFHLLRISDSLVVRVKTAILPQQWSVREELLQGHETRGTPEASLAPPSHRTDPKCGRKRT